MALASGLSTASADRPVASAAAPAKVPTAGAAVPPSQLYLPPHEALQKLPDGAARGTASLQGLDAESTRAAVAFTATLASATAACRALGVTVPPLSLSILPADSPLSDRPCIDASSAMVCVHPALLRGSRLTAFHAVSAAVQCATLDSADPGALARLEQHCIVALASEAFKAHATRAAAGAASASGPQTPTGARVSTYASAAAKLLGAAH